MLILGIETSCDETAAAVVKNGTEVLSNSIRTSIDLHKKYGGVVPEIAAREHIKIILPVIEDALNTAKVTWKEIDAIAVTVEPGLVGSLLVGINTAKVLAKLKSKPLIKVNHIHGHIFSTWLRSLKHSNHISDQDLVNSQSPFPIVTLTVSGGHNEIYVLKDFNKIQLIGETLDDAAGEAFDKVAKMLHLSYPGGPIVSKMAESGDINRFTFPRSWLEKDSFDFSFSGLKTSVLYTLQKIENITPQDVSDICVCFQESVCDVLSTKVMRAAKKYNAKEIHVVGGVSANKRLRECIHEKNENNYKIRFPENIRFCTDNAAMIAAAAYFQNKENFR